MTTAHGTMLSAVTLNSPDPSALARFYAQLLGWTHSTPLRAGSVDSDRWVMLPNLEGGVGLSFQREDLYVRPVWPASPGEQQMTMHLEVSVVDLEAGCVHAESCGAVLAEPQPQDDVRVHLDPDGHPFCLFIAHE